MLFIVVTALVCSLQTADLSAHFLFIRINPQAEAGRSVEVFFSELAAAGDPRFITKVAPTTLVMQTQPGEFKPLAVERGVDRLRGALPVNGPVSVDGMLLYGVLKREVPFRLEYYPKSMSGDAEALNAMKANSSRPVEIVPHFDGETVTLTLLQNGKPVPHAKFTTVDDDLANEELEADASGKAVFKPGSPGHYCIYAKVVVNEGGELDGTKYTEVRLFPTLAFHWPLVRTEADPEAVKLFQDAVATRAVWHNFPGFTAAIEGSAAGRSFTGTATVAADGAVTLKIDEETSADWVKEQLGSIVMHRRAESESQPPTLYFSDRETSHPLGRLLTFVGGQFASSYRVQDGQIREVNRNFGEQNMTITVLENTKNAEDKFLPHLYNVQYWNAADGKLSKSQTVENRWQRVGDFDLPTLATMTEASSSGVLIKTLRLSEHKLLTAAPK